MKTNVKHRLDERRNWADAAGLGPFLHDFFCLGQGVIGVSDRVSRGDCSTLPGNELPLLAEKVRGCYSSGPRFFTLEVDIR